jgi:hypothetical protein
VGGGEYIATVSNFVNVVGSFTEESEKTALCGNGIVESGEDCDVGYMDTGESSKCCKDCKFLPNAKCR